MVEEGNWKATVGHHHPHQHRLHTHNDRAESRDTTLTVQEHPKYREGLSTLGFPSTHIPSEIAYGIPITVVLQSVAHNAHKGRCNRDHPAGDNIHGMV